MDIEDNITKCLNCGKEFSGKFCPNCGQKANTKRLKLREITEDFVGSIIGGDNKFVNTIICLCYRPGHMAREYLQGHRSRYYNPIQMLMWIISIYAIFSYLIGHDPISSKGLFEDMNNVEAESSWDSFYKLLKDWAHTITSNKLYMMIITAIVTVVPYRYAFRKHKILRKDGAKLAMNNTEQFYALIYESCMEMLLAILILPFSLISEIAEEFVKNVNNYADFLLTVILYKQIYRIKWWKCIKRCILAYILSFIYGIIFILIFIVLIMIVYTAIYGVKEFIIEQ